MKEEDRKLMRRRLDAEMRPYRQAAEKNATRGLLRAVRLALGIPPREIAAVMGMRPSNVFYMEERERKGKIGLQVLSRAAEAIGCKLVYGIVPKDGLTMEQLCEQRMWAHVLGVPDLQYREREQVLRAVMKLEDAE